SELHQKVLRDQTRRRSDEQEGDECRDEQPAALRIVAGECGIEDRNLGGTGRAAHQSDEDCQADQAAGVTVDEGQEDGNGFHSSPSSNSAPTTTASSGACRATSSAQRARSIACASPATVGSSKKVGNGTSSWKALRSRDTSCVVSSEWPPRSKKLSSAPTRSTPSSSDHIAAN